MPTLSENKWARRDYEILDEVEAGLELLGHEVKPVRAGQMKLRGAFVKIVGGALVLLGAFKAKPIWGILAVLGVIFSAVYMLWMVERVFFGTIQHEENKSLRDLLKFPFY